MLKAPARRIRSSRLPTASPAIILIPRKMAREATAEALNAIENVPSSADKHREAVRRAEAEDQGAHAQGQGRPAVTARGGEGGKLYGTVTNEQLAAGAEGAARRGGGQAPAWSRRSRSSPPDRHFVTLRLTAGVCTRMLVNVKIAEK